MVALLGDIGGTNIRFSLLKNDEIGDVTYFKTSDFSKIEDVIDLYLNKVDEKPSHFVFGVAGIVQKDVVKLTNADFEIDKERLKNLYPNIKITLVNDFILQGYGVLKVDEKNLRQIGLGKKDKGVQLVLGPGTGLGSCFVIPKEDGSCTILSSESGHACLSAITPNQQKILAEITKDEMPVSFEDVVSGSGLCRLYQAVLKINQLAPDEAWLKEKEQMKKAFDVTNVTESSFIPLRPKEITALAEQKDEVALLTFWYFFEFLGVYASNLALTLKTTGGVYLVGNLLNIPSIKNMLIRSEFRKYFELKGVFANYLKEIPIFLVEKGNIQIDGLIYLSKNL